MEGLEQNQAAPVNGADHAAASERPLTPEEVQAERDRMAIEFRGSGEGRKCAMYVKEIKEILRKHGMLDIVIEDTVFISDEFAFECMQRGVRMVQSEVIHFVSQISLRKREPEPSPIVVPPGASGDGTRPGIILP